MRQPARYIPNGQYANIVGKRVGIMLHYDDSGTDDSAMAWFEDPACKVSYNWLVLDDGEYVEIAPANKRAYHAGKCKPSLPALSYAGANSAFYGVAAATNDRHKVTQPQLDTIVELCKHLFEKHGWDTGETWRITGHDAEAWPRGRKVDPTGKKKSDPILSVAEVRRLVAE